MNRRSHLHLVHDVDLPLSIQSGDPVARPCMAAELLHQLMDDWQTIAHRPDGSLVVTWPHEDAFAEALAWWSARLPLQR